MINELVSNSLKHAFPKGRPGNLAIRFRTVGQGNFELVVKDNGVGMPEAVSIANQDSFGLVLVNCLVDQIHGSMEIDRTNGTTFRVVFERRPTGERI